MPQEGGSAVKNQAYRMAMLYDFYGELLTDHQKEIYEQFILEDLSLGEIARDAGISRQGVHDLVKRCDRTLQEYEEKLHLVSRFLTVKEQIHKIREILDQEPAEDISVLKSEIRKISDEILEEL